MTQKNTKYSLKWADGVVQEFARSYPRATNFVDKILGITPEMPTEWLAKPDVRWKQYTTFVKIFAAWLNFMPLDAKLDEEVLNRRVAVLKKQERFYELCTGIPQMELDMPEIHELY